MKVGSHMILVCAVLLGVAALAVGGLAWMRQRELAAALQDTEDRLDRLERDVGAAESERRVLAQALEQTQNRFSTLPGKLENTRQRLDDRLDDLRGQLDRTVGEYREPLAELQQRQNALEAYWAQKGEFLPAIPDEQLEQGYRVEWTGDEFLPLEPVAEGVILLDDGAGVSLSGGGYLRSTVPATTLSKALYEAADFSIEVVCKPANLDQHGPARIVSVSRDPAVRNFTVGQERDRAVIRLRTSTTNANGSDPVLVSTENALTTDPHHLVFVRTNGVHVLYLDGTENARAEIGGDLTPWDLSFPLVIGNEVGGGRTWEGEIYQVTFFTKPLSAEQVKARVARWEGLGEPAAE